MDLPWIAYAIFHPRAASSSWHQLTLKGFEWTDHSTYVLTAMARGNNLLALLDGTPPTSDAYYSAQLMPGTVVHVKPRNVLSELLPSGTRGTVFVAPSKSADRAVTVDVCGITSLDSASWGKWVAVVVPAYGLGWVRANTLVRVRAHSPSPCSLSGLRLSRRYSCPPEPLLHVLRPLGPTLTFLDMHSYHNVAASTLEAILCACPFVKTLVVNHSGELWSDTTYHVAPFETRLEQLELRVHADHASFAVPTRDHLNVSLGNLQALRLCVDNGVGDPPLTQLQANQAVLEQVLRRATALMYLHWHKARVVSSRPSLAYVNTLDWTSTAMRMLRLTDAKYRFAHTSLSPSCAAAFCSVVARQPIGSALGCLTDRGLLATIFAFATSAVPRRLVFEPAMRALPASPLTEMAKSSPMASAAIPPQVDTNGSVATQTCSDR